MIEEAEEVLPDVMTTAEGMTIIVMAVAVMVVMAAVAVVVVMAAVAVVVVMAAVESKKTGPVPQRFFAVETIGVTVVIDIINKKGCTC